MGLFRIRKATRMARLSDRRVKAENKIPVDRNRLRAKSEVAESNREWMILPATHKPKVYISKARQIIPAAQISKTS